MDVLEYCGTVNLNRTHIYTTFLVLNMREARGEFTDV